MYALTNGVDIDLIKDNGGVGFRAYITNGVLGIGFTALVSVMLIALGFMIIKKTVGKAGFKAQIRQYWPMVLSGFVFSFVVLGIVVVVGNPYWAGDLIARIRGS